MTPLVIGLAIVVVVILIAVAVGMRHVRNTERADFEDLPGERGATRGGTTRGRPDLGSARDRQRPRPDRLPAQAAGGPRSRDPEERAGRRGDRAASGAEPGRDARRYEAARGGRGQDAGDDEPDFRTAQRKEARAQARGRQARGKRDDDGDWPSTEWDELSDADYWKEVASDRPLVTTARVAQPGHDARPARPSRDLDGTGHTVPPGRRAAEPQHGPEGPYGQERPLETGPLPVRGAPQPAAAGRGHDFLAAPAAARGQDPVRPEPARPSPARPGAPRPATGRPGQARPAPAAHESGPRRQRPGASMPADDDPLTSPSFPRIVTSDSRSYHNGRPAVPAVSPADPAAHSAPTTQFASYGTGAARPADGRRANGHDRALADSNGYDRSLADSSANTAPRSYRPDAQPGAGSYGTRSRPPGSRPPAAGNDILASPPQQPRAPQPSSLQQSSLPQQPRPPAPGPRPAAASPAGNPYGSYVSADLPGYQDLPPSAYQPGHSGPGQPASGPADRRGSHYRPGPSSGDAAPRPGAGEGSWYPGMPGTIGPAPGSLAPPPRAGLPDVAGAHGRANGNGNGHGHRGPSGYPPAPYPPGAYPPGLPDAAGYPPAGYGAGPEMPGYPSAGRHSARPPEPARYFPPEFYGRDGHGGR
jgi:hypothetical protein